MVKSILFIAIYLINSYSFIYGQNPKIDSLWKEFNKSKHDTTQCDIYLKLGLLYKNENPDTSLYCLNKALNIAESRKYEKQEANALRYIGIYYKNNGLYDKSLEFQLKSLKISEKLGNLKEVSGCYTNIANINYSQGLYDKAISFYMKSLKISEELKDKIGISNSYYNIGNVQSDLKQFDKAIEYYIKSLKISEELKDIDGMADCYGTIGLIYEEQKQFNKALDNHLTSLKLYTKSDNKRGMSGCFSNIGLIYYHQGFYDKAIDFYKKSLKNFEEIGDIYGVMDSYLNISSINVTLADSAALTEIQRLKFLNNAVEYGTKAYNCAKEVKAVPIQNSASNSLLSAYKKLEDYKKAFEYSEIYIATKDSMFSEEKTKVIAEVGVKYEAEKKQLKIENLEKDNTIQIEKSRKQKAVNYALICGLILLIGVIIMVYRNYVQKKKANKILEEKNLLINQQKEEISSQTEELKAINENLQDVNENLLNVNEELEKLSIVARKTDNVIIIMDNQGNLLWANEAFERLYELSFEQYLSDFGNNIVTATMNTEAITQIKDCISTGKSISYTSCFVTKKGFNRWTQTQITPIINNEGKVYRLVAVDSDITNLKNAENEIIIKNKKITDSIRYAKRIQDAFLPNIELIQPYLPQTFILYNPRDIVSGDFYWFHNIEDKSICVLADCTGHGVPGAFMSMIGNTILNDIIINQKIIEPVTILEILDKEVKKTLRSENNNENDGMALSICVFDSINRTIKIACAEQSLLILTDEKSTLLEGSLYGIGSGNPKFPFTQHLFDYKENLTVYMFSDGFADQFGGPQGMKFMQNNFIELLIKNSNLTLDKQKITINTTLNEWMNIESTNRYGLKNEKPITYSQIDDITVWGIKV